MEWLTTAQLAADAVKLAGMLPADTARIVGIPRSGMIVASIVATHLHLPLWELTGGHFRRLAPGSRGFNVHEGSTVIIDDTVYGGNAIERAKKETRDAKALYAAVYVRPDRVHLVDFFVRAVNARSHLLEWNFFNNHGIQVAGVATDFDGVLCHDPTCPDADEGPALEVYREWLTRATPLWLPRAQPISLICTARLEKFRPETEAWLQRWGVRWHKLRMCPADRASQRGDIAAWKAQAYAASKTAYFIESDPRQAERIFEITKKQVICPGAAKVWAI